MSVNQGKKWTKKEENELIHLLKQNKSYRDISTSLKRTIGSIKTRRNKIAYDLFLDGQSSEVEYDRLLDQICLETRLTLPQLENVIHRDQQDHNSNSNNRSSNDNKSNDSSVSDEIQLLKKEIGLLNQKLKILQSDIDNLKNLHFYSPRVVFSGIVSQIISMSVVERKSIEINEKTKNNDDEEVLMKEGV